MMLESPTESLSFFLEWIVSAVLHDLKALRRELWTIFKTEKGCGCCVVCVCTSEHTEKTECYWIMASRLKAFFYFSPSLLVFSEDLKSEINGRS